MSFFRGWRNLNKNVELDVWHFASINTRTLVKPKPFVQWVLCWFSLNLDRVTWVSFLPCMCIVWYAWVTALASSGIWNTQLDAKSPDFYFRFGCMESWLDIRTASLTCWECIACVWNLLLVDWSPCGIQCGSQGHLDHPTGAYLRCAIFALRTNAPTQHLCSHP